MFRKLKWRCAVLSLVAIVVTLLSQSTLAYYTTIGTATNVVTSGGVRMYIVEKTDQGTDFPSEGVYVMPGDVVSKRVSIQSDCDHPFYLRVKIVYGSNAVELPSEDCFKLNIKEEYWKLNEDGWYYYTGIVEPGQTTPNVFSHVEIVGSKVDKSYIGKTLSLTVKAQAVQSENNPLVEGDVSTAKGWPKE